LEKEEKFIKNPVYFVIRGFLGSALKKYFCVREGDCEKCILKDTCIYSVVFSPKNIKREEINISDIPRPFVIHNIELNEFLNVDMILIGEKNKEYLPYFIFAFEKIGKLKSVETIKGTIVYNDGRLIEDIDSEIKIPEEEIKENFIILNFITPTRIKYKGHYTENIEFHILISQLLRRIKMLNLFYGDKDKFLFDTKKLLDNSKNIMIKYRKIEWCDWGRYSRRQDEYMKLGGIVGEIGYEGNFKEFSYFLRLGEYIHIGKNSTFGLGRYILKEGKNG